MRGVLFDFDQGGWMYQILKILIATLLIFETGAARAEVDGHTVLKFQLEAEAFNAEKNDANP